MSERFYAATRKGLFTLEHQTTGQWSISNVAFLGDPVTMVLPDRSDGLLYAALNLGHFGVKLHRSHDAGKTWGECAAPAYPQQGQDPSAPSVIQVWSLEPEGPEQAGLWAGTLPGGLFRSRDRGASWELVESLWNKPERKEWFGGGAEHPGIHSICVNPHDSAHVTLGVSCGGVWVTKDGGDSWECRAQGMRADFMPPERAYDPNIQDPHRVVQCSAAPEVFWAQHHNGVFLSCDEACSWQEVPNVQPSAFGFAVAVHPHDPKTAWFVPGVKDECRLPVGAQLVVSRTRDGGETFEVLRKGLPQEHCYDLVYRHGLDIDSSGDRLAFGSTTGGLWVSENQGDSWHCISTHLPPVYCVRFDVA